MQSLGAELLLDCACELGEGCLWDDRLARLFFVDIVGDRVYSLDPATMQLQGFAVGENVGTVVVSENGRLLLGVRSGFAWLDPDTGSVTRLGGPEADRSDTRFNDGKCDPRGRFWAGTMVETKGPATGGLYCLETDLVWSKRLGGIGCSNGLVWSETGSQFFYIDTRTQQIWAFEFELASGALGPRRVVMEVEPSMGAPDGMAIDEFGCLWVALYGGSRIICVDPSTGQIVREVRVPVSQPTSCAFGGGQRKELYISTARSGLNQAERERQTFAGSLFAVGVPVQGLPCHRFGARL